MTGVESLGARGARKAKRFISRASARCPDRVLRSIAPEGAIHFREPGSGYADRQALADLRGGWRGRRCFLLGTAPSVRDIDLSPLTKDFVLGLNKGFLLAERIGRPLDGGIISNPSAAAEYGRDMMDSGIRHAFFSTSALSALPRAARRGAVAFEQWDCPGMCDGFFQHDATRPLYQSGTVAHSALQLACWMGFEEILTIGVDLDFPKDDPHFYATRSTELERSRRASQANAERMVAGIEVARDYFDRHSGPRLVNAGKRGTRNPAPHLDSVENRFQSR